MLAVLRALGAPVETERDVGNALRARREELWQRRIEPVTVAWDGRLEVVRIRLPAGSADARVRRRIDLETGQRLDLPDRDPMKPTASAEIGRQRFVEGSLTLQGLDSLPMGYHRLTIDIRGDRSTSLVIAAPARAAEPAAGKRWGVFLPLYALRTARSLGIGDLTDLQAVTEWVAGQGGSIVATLPLLASFLGEDVVEPGPYAPASRLFWNELYIDPEAVPELKRSPEARALLESSEYRNDRSALARRTLVDYRATMAAKRRVLEALAGTFFEGAGPGQADFEEFAKSKASASDYARFRAAGERHGKPWSEWPARERRGHLPEYGGNRDAFRYHLYVQWIADRQMAAVAARARSLGTELYFDLPLGVHPYGYDVWRERDAFLKGVSAGAPPDAFFRNGQDWGFPPLAPEGIREQGYRYPVQVLRHLMNHAGVLRLDHAMGLHRLFVVPTGMKATEGAYIQYRPEEFYAILCLESRRAGVPLVGEDLGTVPAFVPRALERHGIQRTYVMQFALTGRRGTAVRPPKSNTVAGFNTHDLPTFAGFWRGLDIERWLAQGWLDESEARRARGKREIVRKALVAELVRRGLLSATGQGDEGEIFRACLRYLALSETNLMVISLEDLWGETLPQNVPGTVTEYPNWQRRARYGLERFRRRPEVAGTLAEIDRLRKRGGST